MVGDIEIIGRLIVITVLSGLIGIERERHGRAAGLRTHILVGLGSTLIMLTSMHIFEIYKGVSTADPARIAAQVVSGIGFLGAGTIIRFRASIRGLTTAASLWAAAGIGLAVGSGFYLGAYVTTLLVLGALFFLTRLERNYLRRDWYRVLVAETNTPSAPLPELRSILHEYEVEIRDFEVSQNLENKNLSVKMSLKLLTNAHDDEIVSQVAKLPGIIRANWA